ncbi:MAG: collagenase-like protease, partial [Muribaculaceae bacterium]|nr:collagenase-like protease [Muribaculaceae bacterium]
MASNIRDIELLAPAKDADTAIEAINCGADAVYIGASKFGARYSASNSVDDICRVVEYAHLFNVKVYVT